MLPPFGYVFLGMLLTPFVYHPLAPYRSHKHSYDNWTAHSSQLRDMSER